jgi:hypothetical protein
MNVIEFGTQFTCSTGTKVQILTQKALPDSENDLPLYYDSEALKT